MSKEKQRELEEINRPMNEELFNGIEKLYQEIAKIIAESEQIEEMAHEIFEHFNCRVREEEAKRIAKHLVVNAGYRKQIEGEWIEQVRVSKEGRPLLRHYKCNLCGAYLATQANFCPNCGAKMKGGE